MYNLPINWPSKKSHYHRTGFLPSALARLTCYSQKQNTRSRQARLSSEESGGGNLTQESRAFRKKAEIQAVPPTGINHLKGRDAEYGRSVEDLTGGLLHREVHPALGELHLRWHRIHCIINPCIPNQSHIC